MSSVFDSRRPVLRFAPSPNGALHLGHAYSALRNERLARELDGALLLRIEDLDRTRCKPEHEARLVADLDWLGLRFEGPPRRQSEHRDDYARALRALDARGLVYRCFCSRADIARASTGRDPDGAPRYDGACRGLAREMVKARLARGERAQFRLDMARALAERAGPARWREYREGSVETLEEADPGEWGDFALGGRDMAASYHLAVVVDDALQGVSDVVRGRDLVAATAAHRLLQDLLDLPAPRYRHHRLALDADGAKLSKSRTSPSLAALRQAGVAAQEIRAALGFAPGVATRLAVRLS